MDKKVFVFFSSILVQACLIEKLHSLNLFSCKFQKSKFWYLYYSLYLDENVLIGSLLIAERFYFPLLKTDTL